MMCLNKIITETPTIQKCGVNCNDKSFFIFFIEGKKPNQYKNCFSLGPLHNIITMHIKIQFNS